MFFRPLHRSRRKPRRRLAATSSTTTLLCVVATVAGCALDGSSDLKLPRVWPASETEAATAQRPARIITSWTHTVLHRPGQKPQRGFGGRLLFFDRESEDSVRVEGQLVVYAFDETNRAAHDTQPTRRYVYPPEQFARLESPSKLGPSYSVWVPWDEVGGEQKHISLIARFEPVDGPLIVGEQTRHFLPGAMTTTPANLDTPQSAVELATHEVKVERVEQNVETPKMRTTAIPMPRRMQ